MRFAQVNFAKGEIAEELVARIDVASYSAAAKRARNVVILKYGGLQKRPGTRLVAPALDSAHPVRLLPFQFSLTQAYALEFGEGYMRAAANGGLVIEPGLTITAITKAGNAQVTIAYHGYSVGEQIYFKGVLGMTQINGLFGKVVTVVDANNFTVAVNTTSFSTFTGDSGGTTNVAPPPAPPPAPGAAAPPPTPAPPSSGSGGSYSGDDGGGAGPVGGDRP